jgi:very-short-patch-repair endonuclease
MNQATGMLFLLLVVVIVVAVLKGKRRPLADYRYYKKELLTAPEQVLLHRLISALPGKLVFAQVAMRALVDVKSHDRKTFWSKFGEIQGKYVDFVVCEPSGAVITVIELDDSSHQREDRKKADLIKDKAFTEAGVRLIRIQGGKIPDTATIQKLVEHVGA